MTQTSALDWRTPKLTVLGDKQEEGTPTGVPWEYLMTPMDFCRRFPFSFGNFCKCVLKAQKTGSATQLECALEYLKMAREELPRFELELRVNSSYVSRLNNRYLTTIFISDDYAANIDQALMMLSDDVQLAKSSAASHKSTPVADKPFDLNQLPPSLRALIQRSYPNAAELTEEEVVAYLRGFNNILEQHQKKKIQKVLTGYLL